MNDRQQLNRAKTEKAFRIIGQYLLDRKTLGEIGIYGGSAILFQFDWRKTSLDVDARVTSIRAYRSNSSKTSMTSKQLQRPQTLADVAEIARRNSSEFPVALDEFVDEFYLDHPDKMAQQRRLDVIPPFSRQSFD
jgi:hypothetical protein